jgi:hypothetical protein
MDYVPVFHFISALIIFGLLMYMFNPMIDYLSAVMGVDASTNVYAQAMFWLWGILAGINLFGSGIRFIMFMEKGE